MKVHQTSSCYPAFMRDLTSFVTRHSKRKPETCTSVELLNTFFRTRLSSPWSCNPPSLGNIFFPQLQTSPSPQDAGLALAFLAVRSRGALVISPPSGITGIQLSPFPPSSVAAHQLLALAFLISSARLGRPGSPLELAYPTFQRPP